MSLWRLLLCLSLLFPPRISPETSQHSRARRARLPVRGKPGRERQDRALCLSPKSLLPRVTNRANTRSKDLGTVEGSGRGLCPAHFTPAWRTHAAAVKSHFRKETAFIINLITITAPSFCIGLINTISFSPQPPSLLLLLSLSWAIWRGENPGAGSVIKLSAVVC